MLWHKFHSYRKMILLMSHFRMEKNEAWTTMYKYTTKNLQLRHSTTRYLLQNLTLGFSSAPKDFVCALMEVNWSLITKAPANVTFINKYLLHLSYVDEDHILCASNLSFHHVLGFLLKRWPPCVISPNTGFPSWWIFLTQSVCSFSASAVWGQLCIGLFFGHRYP